jgi:hypothetical protein
MVSDEALEFALVTFIGVGAIGSLYGMWKAGRTYGHREMEARDAAIVKERFDAVLQMDTPLRRQEYECAAALFKDKYTARWQDLITEDKGKKL